MKPVRLTLQNGHKLICISTDKFKSELFSVQFLLPLDETAQATSLLFSVLRRGTQQFPDRALLNRYLDEMYSTAISFQSQRLGDRHALGICADFLGARYVNEGELGLLPKVVELLSSLLLAPATDEGGLLRTSFVESEKTNLIDAIRAAINTPRSYAISKCRALLCENEPFGRSIFGSEKDAALHTQESLTAHYQALLSMLCPVFVYVGSAEPACVAELAQNAFAGLTAPRISYESIAKSTGGELRQKTEQMPLCQGKLAIGMRGDISLSHPLAPALMVLNEIYGASPASKLFLNVREKQSLCYHCSSMLDLYKGVLIASAGMKPENREITQHAMLAELGEIKRGNVSNDELVAAQGSLAYSYRQAFDNPSVLARFYTAREFAELPETIEQWRERVAAVTLDGVVEAAGHVDTGAIYFLQGTLGSEGEDEL